MRQLASWNVSAQFLHMHFPQIRSGKIYERPVKGVSDQYYSQYSGSWLAGEMLSCAVSAGMCSVVSSPRASV